MTIQSVCGATVVVVAMSVVTVEPAHAQRRDGNLLPQGDSGQVTAVGCLLRGRAVRGGKDDYVLARPARGPVASVPEATCTAESGANALQLDNAKENGVTEAMVGRWVEISGRLESETDKDPDNLRELDVASVKLVPVVIPKPPTPPPAPAPAPAPPPAAAPRPTPPPPAAAPPPPPPADPPKLPKTASPLPVMGLAGLLSLGVGLALRSFRRA